MEQDPTIPELKLVDIAPTEKPKAQRARNVVWDVVVDETAANPFLDSGKIARAVSAIRDACLSEGIAGEELIAEEVRIRAAAYRRMFDGCALTPLALASHWFRVEKQQVTRSAADAFLRMRS